MAEPISIQQLKDASEDAITLADFIYKPANVMIPRRLAADINSLQYYLDYMSSYAQRSYETYDEMVANAVNLPSGVSAFVTNDLDATKNGIYTYNGTSFVKGDYQPENAAKDYVEEKLGGLQVFDGKVRAQDVSTTDGSTQEVKNAEFVQRQAAYPFEGSYSVIDSFELGATITQRNEALRHAATGQLYRWAGDLPKVVPTNSTPSDSGGIGTNSWLEVSDTALRQELLGLGGAAKIPFNAIVFNTLAELNAAQWLHVGLTVQTLGYYERGDGGGNIYLVQPSGTVVENSHIVLSNGFIAKGLFPSGSVNVKQLGAKGDGVTDDYPTIFKAINLFPNLASYEIIVPAKTYKLSQGLFITRPLRIISTGGKEEAGAIFDFAGAVIQESTRLSGGGGICVVHESTLANTDGFIKPTGQIGNYGGGATILGIVTRGSPTNGIMLNAPATIQFCWGINNTGHGIVVAGDSALGLGNANHSDILYCRSNSNGKSGIFAMGSDGNSFNIVGCLTNHNKHYGICDNSLLGGTVIGCESDGNLIADYNCRGGSLDNSGLGESPSTTAWINNYAEDIGGERYSLSAKQLVIGALGHQPTITSGLLSGLAGNVFNRDVVVADGINLAHSKEGNFGQLSKAGLLVGATGYTDKATVAASGGYFNFGLAGYNGISFKVGSDFNEHIKRGRPYMPNGFALGTGHSQTSAATIPTTGAAAKGAICWNENPTSGGHVGWVCVTGGATPTWKPFGKIEA